MLETPHRMAIKLSADIATAVVNQLDNANVLAYEQTLLALADAIAARYFLQGPNVARADKSNELS
jgi:hypothetical protein